jgi:hypothetical protein
MATPVSIKFRDLDEVQLRGMITHTRRQYAYLDPSSDDAVYALARLMTEVDFMHDRVVTPVRASLEFLQTIENHRRAEAEQNPSTAKTPLVDGVIHERDLVFVIKMFGIRLRSKGGLLQFLPRNEWIRGDDGDAAPAVEVNIDSPASAKGIEFEISAIKRNRKVHARQIDAAFNRLTRRFRDAEMARVFATLVTVKGMSIGEAKDALRTEHNIKDHEYNRIRDAAVELKIFDPASRRKHSNGRVTLDPDVLEWVESRVEEDLSGRMHRKTLSQMVNEMVRHLHQLVMKTQLAPKSNASARRVVKKNK